MVPVEQTRLSPDEGGNCHAACIASILECPLEDVPQLLPGDAVSDAAWDEYRPRLNAWLRERNLIELYFSAGDWKPTGYAIAGVKSVRFPGFEHAVVALNGEIVWDPHPGRADGCGELVGWSVFQVIDPALIDH